jgi:hypothetical protein
VETDQEGAARRKEEGDQEQTDRKEQQSRMKEIDRTKNEFTSGFKTLSVLGCSQLL